MWTSWGLLWLLFQVLSLCLYYTHILKINSFQTSANAVSVIICVWSFELDRFKRVTEVLLEPASALGPAFLNRGSRRELRSIEYYLGDYFLSSPKDGT